MYVCTIDLSFQAHKVEKLVVKILSFRFSSLAYVPVLKEATVAMVLQLYSKLRYFEMLWLLLLRKRKTRNAHSFHYFKIEEYEKA